MRSTTRVGLATVLIASLGGALHAQAPAPTVAQLQARIQRLEYDLAHVQQLADLCHPVLSLGDAPPASTGRAQTLGEAAAAAALVKHEWATINVVPRYDPANQPAPVALEPVSAVSSSSVPPMGTPPGSPEEAAWKNRMRPLRVQLENDRTSLVVAQARVASVQTELAKAHYVIEAATIKQALLEAQADLSRLTAAVINDQRAVYDLEIEAKRANVPPGWLVIK